MGVTFSIRGDEYDYEDMEAFDRWMDLANGNAASVMIAVGLQFDGNSGEIRGGALKKLCEAYLASGAEDRPRLGQIADRVIIQARRAGYVHEQVTRLLKIAELAGDLGVVVYY